MVRASILIAFLITAVSVGFVFAPFAVRTASLVTLITPTETIVLPDEIAACEAVILAHLELSSRKERKADRYYFVDRKISAENYVVFPAPRWPPQNRPLMATSKPAISSDAGTEVFTP